MIWVLLALQHAHGGTFPSLLCFPIFGSAMAVGLGVMFPLGYYLSCMVWSIRSNPSATDAQFGRMLFFKYCRQLGRIAVMAGFGCSFVSFLLCLWPANTPSPLPAEAALAQPLPLWQGSGLTLAALGIKIATLRFYYNQGRGLEKEIRKGLASNGRTSAVT